MRGVILTALCFGLGLNATARAQTSAQEWLTQRANPPLEAEDVLISDGEDGVAPASGQDYFSKSEIKPEDQRKHEQATRNLRDASSAVDAAEMAPLFQSGVAAQNIERMKEAELDFFVVGAGATRTSQFRDVGMLIATTDPPSTDRPGLVKWMNAPSPMDINAPICSGVFVSDQTILTAAHCVCQLGLDAEANRARYVLFWGPDVSTDIVVGGNGSGQLARERIAAPLSRSLSPVTMNPRFCEVFRATNRVIGPDIALVYLSRKALLEAKFNPSLEKMQKYRPTQLAWPDLYLSGINPVATVVGYGITDAEWPNGDENFEPNIAAKVTANIPIADMICANPSSAVLFNCQPGQEMVLIDQIFGNDTCGGDSGGPVYLRYFSSYYLVGITSRAALPSGDCGAGGIYALMTPRVVAWIRRNTIAVDPTF